MRFAGRTWGDGPILGCQGPTDVAHDRTIDAVTISHEIGGCFIPGKCLDNLPGNPLRGRMCRHRIVYEPSSVVAQDDQAVEQLKPIVGTTNRSVAAMPSAWLRRNVSQL